MLHGRCWLVALALVVLAAPLVARAQPAEAPPPGPGDAGPIEPPPAPPPPAPQPPAPPPPAVEREVAPPPVADAPDAPERPAGLSVGIGLGYDLPTDLSLPDTATVRFRLPSGLTFEPFVVFGLSGSSYDFEAGDSTSESSSEIGLGTNVRIPVIGHGPVDLLVVAGARFDLLSSDPDGADNESSTVGASLLWGLGLEYWLGAHGAVSLTALNPLVSYQSTTEAQFDGDATQSSWSAAAIFRPDVLFLVHLFL